MKLNNGTMARANFINGKLNGRCEVRKPSGELVVGEYTNGVANGIFSRGDGRYVVRDGQLVTKLSSS